MRAIVLQGEYTFGVVVILIAEIGPQFLVDAVAEPRLGRKISKWKRLRRDECALCCIARSRGACVFCRGKAPVEIELLEQCHADAGMGSVDIRNEERTIPIDLVEIEEVSDASDGV